MEQKHKLLINTLIILGIAIVAFFFMGINESLKVTTYEIETDKIGHPIKLALIADLHSCSYGNEEDTLLNRIDEEKPDAIMLCGDIFDDQLLDDNAQFFLKGVSKKYPCFYVTGNHEYMAGEEAFEDKMKKLEKYDITWLSDESIEIELNGDKISLSGVNDPYINSMKRKYYKTDPVEFTSRLEKVESTCNHEDFTVLLSHRPEYINTYKEYGFDLVLSGHAHGGQWRLPFTKNGLFAPHQGFFPKYSGGFYTADHTNMIVSCGLSKESTFLPRLYNKPEVVIINLK